jgi:DnaA family protein
MQQIALDIGLAHTPTLENFYPGPNGAVLQHLRQWLQSSAPAATTYLWGPEGSGKSHLLWAVCAGLSAQGRAVGHLDAHSTVACDFDERWVAVLMDDVHLYSPALQHTAFSWFVQAHALKRPVLAAGRLAPVDLALREDLRTRLGWAMCWDCNCSTRCKAAPCCARWRTRAVWS